MARVTVQVRVRDLTGNQLSRLNRSFNRLGDSVNRFSGDRTQGNLDRLRGSVSGLGDDLSSLRGRIPEAEFQRLSNNFRQLDAQARGLNLNSSARQIGELRNHLNGLNDDINRLNRVRTPDITPRIRPPGRRDTENRFIRALKAPFRLIGGILGGTLSDGVGQGIINGFKAAGPYLAGVFAVAILGALTFLGAAIAGLLIFAIGGAFTALGVFLALQADGVAKKWKKTLSDLKPLFVDAASGLQPLLEHYRLMIADLAKDFAPHFKSALDAAAPHVQTFLDHVINGFKILGQRSAKDLEEAFNVFLAAFGPLVEEDLAGLGDALAALARTVRDHSTEIADALRIVIGTITFVVDAVNFLANAWILNLRTTTWVLGQIVLAVATLVDSVLVAAQTILEGLDFAFGGLPGIGDKFANAGEAVGRFRASASADLSRLGAGLRDYGKTLDHENRERKLKVNIESWKNQLKIARSDLSRTSNQKARAKITANINDLTQKIKNARGQLNALNGKTATTFVVTAYIKKGAPGPYAPGRASGGLRGLSAAATGGARGNMTLVGEQGPELVNLAPGSRVRSNPDTRRLMSGGGGSAPTTIVIDSSNDPVDRLLLKLLRHAVRVEGGDAQIVFGGRRRQA